MILCCSFAAAVETNKSDIFGEMSGASESSQQFGSFESKAVQSSAHVMSVPLQASQRYTLTEDDEVCCTVACAFYFTSVA
jgi:hypothetical protein